LRNYFKWVFGRKLYVNSVVMYVKDFSCFMKTKKVRA
jgi:hypothetical protein